MAPSNAKNLDYLIPAVQKETIISGLLFPPGATYPDGSPIGEVFGRVPVSKGARMATMWKYRSEGQQNPDYRRFKHPYDSGKEITQHKINYEKMLLPLERWSALDGRDVDHLMGTSAPDDLDTEMGVGLREVLYASLEAEIAANVLNTGNYTLNATPGPGYYVVCTGDEWNDATVNPFTDETSGLITALSAMYAAGKFPTDILLGAAEWAALASNANSQDYVRNFLLYSPGMMGEGATLPLAGVERALVINPFPPIKLHVGLATYQAGHAVDGKFDIDEVVSLWSGCLLYTKGNMTISGKPSGQHFCLLADGGDEFSSNENTGFRYNTIDFKYNLYQCHNVISWTNATLLTGLIA
ncbi:MAG: hypothetical protein WC359_12750 [Dehalococcoidia bacterium]|jgi:hypothetical protein